MVDTGPWIFGKKVMLPGGIITNVDHDDEKIFVDRTKDQIKNAPEFDDSLIRDDEYRRPFFLELDGLHRALGCALRGPCLAHLPQALDVLAPVRHLDDDLVHDRLALRAHLVAAYRMDADILDGPEHPTGEAVDLGEGRLPPGERAEVDDDLGRPGVVGAEECGGEVHADPIPGRPAAEPTRTGDFRRSMRGPRMREALERNRRPI